jgi:hypothetical protein
MTNNYLSKQDMLNVVTAHIRDLHAEKYSHQLRIIEFDAAGSENIDQVLYNQIADMVTQYDLRISALEAEKEKVLAMPE